MMTEFRGWCHRQITLLIVPILVVLPLLADAQIAAPPTPPMGWNSCDAHGAAVNEAEVRANADWMAKNLKAFGWQYVVIDIEWFVTNVVPAGNQKNSQYSIDTMGRYTPDPGRFPSAANQQGFKQLAGYIHSLGLKFGIHILQGIPRQAVQDNDPIEGSLFRAADAANPAGSCVWNVDNYDLKDNAAGQAYYDSVARLYASWGVDFIKADCISDPYKGDEIRMLNAALAKTGRPMVLSLSPGPTPIDKEAELEQYSTMWRISDDIWDIWHSDKEFPQGINDQFAHAAAWVNAPRNGHYPDADMLPLGYLGPEGGLGKPHFTQLTRDEQRTMLNLWAISRSPLMMGGDLPHNDAWTTALLTNREVLNVDQQGRDAKVAISSNEDAVWTSHLEASADYYVAVFNRSDQSRTLHYSWTQIGLNGGRHRIRNLWEGKKLRRASEIKVFLRPHASAFYLVRP
jgi:alpha-galactosidase